MAGGLKFRIYVEEGLYCLCSENKGADQLRGYREADLRLCFRICKKRFSHDEAHIKVSMRGSKLHGSGGIMFSSTFRSKRKDGNFGRRGIHGCYNNI